MAPTNVRIASASYANASNSIVLVLLTSGETWVVTPENGSGQANVLSQWVKDGGNIGPYVPPVPGGIVPVGSLLWYSSTTVPPGYLLCNGSEVKRAQYPKLFAVIGTTYGDGNSKTTFNLPDLRGKIVRGWGPVNSVDPQRVFGSSQTNSFGVHRHSITDPGHIHEVDDPGHLHGVDDPGHVHAAIDPGHTHTVTDPGHPHGIGMYEDNLLLGIKIASSAAVITPYFDNNGSIYDFYSPNTTVESANLKINSGSANLQTLVAEANVSDKLNFTGITVNDSVTNIDTTDPDGGPYTTCANLTLIPFIRY